MPQYVEFTKRGGNLVITLTPEGREELRSGDWKDDAERAFFDLIEWQLANGWELITPDEVGALTDATIVSDEVERDDDGELISLGRVYSNIDYYQIESDVEKLLHDGKLIWRGVDDEDEKPLRGLGAYSKRARKFCVTARSPREAAKKLEGLGDDRYRHITGHELDVLYQDAVRHGVASPNDLGFLRRVPDSEYYRPPPRGTVTTAPSPAEKRLFRDDLISQINRVSPLR